MRMLLVVFLVAVLLLAMCACSDSAEQVDRIYITQSRGTASIRPSNSSAAEGFTDMASQDAFGTGSNDSRVPTSSSASHAPQGGTSHTVTEPGWSMDSRPSSQGEYKPPVAGNSSSKVSSTVTSSKTAVSEPETPPSSKTVVYHDVPSKAQINFNSYIQRHSADTVLTYKNVGGQPISLGIYYPKGYTQGKKYPLFVFVHGGGWGSHKIFPDQNGKWAGDYLGFLARYYADKGYISVSIDYRLMQQDGQIDGYGIIDLYEDCFDAVQYLQENQAKYGMDFSDATVLGESAGGHLAAALSTFSYKGKPVFKKAILVNAITDLADPSWSKVVPKNTNNAYLKNLSYAARTEFLSPVDHIDFTTCSTLLIHGTADTVVTPQQSEAYNDKMFANGRKSELHLLRGINHAFLLVEYNQRYAAAGTAIGIIDRWLGV